MKKFIVYLVLVAMISMQGCAYFQKKQRVNLAPFAENAVSIVSEIEYGLSKAKSIHTRKYLNGPAVQKYKERWSKLGGMLRVIVAYSIQLVTISESPMSDSKKADALANYIVDLTAPIRANNIKDFPFTQAGFDSIIQNIRQQKKYFEALNAAQPVVNEFSWIAEKVLNGVISAQEEARLEVALEIEKEHKDLLNYKGVVKEAQTRTLQSMVIISNWYAGQKGIAEKLLENDPQLQYLMPDQKLDKNIAVQIKNLLVYRLDVIKKVNEQLYEDQEQYGKERRELDELISIADRGLEQSKAALAIWRQSHQTMAAGITDPAAIDLFGVAKAAMRSVAPIPIP